MTDARIRVQGEELLLLPERAVFRPAASTLLIADPHFGKAASFRAAGIPVPGGTTTGALERIDAALARTGARRIVFLGDFLHARSGRAAATLAELARWSGRHSALERLLVRGNHDHRAGDPPPDAGIRCLDAPVVEHPFVYAHHPGTAADGYVLAGHLHPGVTLRGTGRQHERLPCFWFGATHAVLPAFGDFTGLAAVEPGRDDLIYVVADGAVLEVR